MSYRVGPGRPPREFQFKPGQSGNPKGARRTNPAMAPDLKTLLEQGLREKVTVRRGDKEKRVSMAAAGIEQLLAQYARGDRHARRDLIALASRIGVDLTVGQSEAIEEALGMALSANDEDLVEDFIQRRIAEHEQRRQSLDDAEVASADATKQPWLGAVR